MGQKVNPHGMRLGIVKTWDAKWYAGKDFAANLHEDIKIRSFLKETLKVANVSNCPVIISGGVSSIEDIKKAKGLKNIEGIIVGKAIYDGDIKLEELAKEIDA